MSWHFPILYGCCAFSIAMWALTPTPTVDTVPIYQRLKVLEESTALSLENSKLTVEHARRVKDLMEEVAEQGRAKHVK